MKKKFSAGQRVVFNQQYVANRKRTYDAGETGTVIRDQDGDTVGVRMDDGTVTYAFAYRLDAIQEHPFKVGDTVRVKNPTDFGGAWNGPMPVDWVFPSGHIRAIHPERGAGGFLPDQVERVGVHQEQREPATEFRIRKHRTALREVRGIPFASQEAAEQAVSRYTPGSVYEIVEVKVVRTVKVEQEVRVIDYQEAA
ncbi:hypothetical protein WT58_04250 [Burkholderia territorii]|uniref:hypothetical protein n=1 Tax=Burkholderia territorii TaxID=1503055 RepID=UPI00075A5B5C|nr:hypothetical protein [Burkholderia territorii]KWH13397.1 hypothetical protein WT58_04250 [Burkholderia territorii]